MRLSSLILNFVLWILERKIPFVREGQWSTSSEVDCCCYFDVSPSLSTFYSTCFAFQAINWSFAIPARRTRRAEADNQETKHFQQQMHVSHTGWTSKGASVTFKIPKGNSIFEKTLENPFFPHGFSYKVNLWKKKYGKFVKGTAFDFRKPLGLKYSNVDGF